MSSLNDLTYKFLNREETTALDSAVLYLSKTNKEVAEEAAQELSAMQARIEELETADKRQGKRLDYIKENQSDGVAIRFALEAEDWEIDEL